MTIRLTGIATLLCFSLLNGDQEPASHATPKVATVEMGFTLERVLADLELIYNLTPEQKNYLDSVNVKSDCHILAYTTKWHPINNNQASHEFEVHVDLQIGKTSLVSQEDEKSLKTYIAF